MSDGTAILACSRYFLGCPRPCLTRAREAKVAEGDLTAGPIGVISARDVSIWGVSGGSVSMGNASAGGIYVDVGVSWYKLLVINKIGLY